MICTKDLTKMYGDVAAVRGLNLQVERGEIYGFLGPNGAGKTTTIMMILGLIKPSSGEISLLGKNSGEDYFGTRRRFGVVPEVQYLYEDMTVDGYLGFFARLYEVEAAQERIDELLDLVSLLGRKQHLIRGLSKGMKQKLGIVRALLHDPELLILDEPVTGLDPHGIREVRNVILEQNRAGKTVFLSSHLLSEVEKTCDRVGIMNKGVLVAEDSMSDLKRRLGDGTEMTVEVDRQLPGLVDSLRSMEFVTAVSDCGNTLFIKTKPGMDYRAEVSRAVVEHGGVVLGIEVAEMTLEDAFITITDSNISLLTREGEA